MVRSGSRMMRRRCGPAWRRRRRSGRTRRRSRRLVARQPIVAVFQRRVPVSSVIPVVTVPVAVTVIVSNPLSLQGVSDADQDIGKQLIGMRVGKCKTRYTRKRQSGNGCLQYVASSQCGHFFGSLKRFNQIGGLTRSGATGAAIITRTSAGAVTAGTRASTLVAGASSAVARTTGTAAGRIAGAAGTVAAGRGITVWARCRTRLRARSGRLIARQPEISILGRRVMAAFIVPVTAVPTTLTVVLTDVVTLHGVAHTDQNVGEETVGIGKRNARNGTECESRSSALNETATGKSGVCHVRLLGRLGKDR